MKRNTRTAEAHGVLDNARTGLDVPSAEVDEALRVTGDLQDRPPLTRDQQRAKEAQASAAEKEGKLRVARQNFRRLHAEPVHPLRPAKPGQGWRASEPKIAPDAVITVAPVPPSRYAVTEPVQDGFAAMGIGRYL